MVGRWFVSFQNGPFKTRTFVHFQVGGVRLRLWSGCFWVKPQGIMTQASILGGVSHPKFPTINHTTVAWGNFLAGIPGSEMILIKRWKKPPMLPRMNKLVWSQHRIFFRKIFHPINPILQNLPANPKHKNPNPNPPNPPETRCRNVGFFGSQQHGPGCTAAYESSAASDVSRLPKSMPRFSVTLVWGAHVFKVVYLWSTPPGPRNKVTNEGL